MLVIERLFAVEPPGDDGPCGTRQKAAEKPDNEAFQHGIPVIMLLAVANRKSSTRISYGTTKIPRAAIRRGVGLSVFRMYLTAYRLVPSAFYKGSSSQGRIASRRDEIV